MERSGHRPGVPVRRRGAGMLGPMLARVGTFLLQGIDAAACEVEIDHDHTAMDARPAVVGLPDTAVKESLDRVRSALTNSGYAFPPGRVLISLAPADLRKEGPLYDLPMALGLMIAQGMLADRSATPARPGRGPAGPVGPGRAQGVPGRAPGPAPAAGSAAHQELLDDLAALDAAGGVGGAATEPPDIRSLLFAGELALDGRLRPVRGVIAMAALARRMGLRGVVVPSQNAAEASVVPGIEVWGPATLAELVGLLRGELDLAPTPPTDVPGLLRQAPASVDFADVRGQEAVKRAIVVAAAGGHNILMLGPAGTGKSMMAKALPGVLPPLTPDEAIDVTRIYSAAGALPEGVSLITARPVRSPHHTASASAVIGGGAVPRPGEVSLAHHGVLFLDELPEFPRDVLETLRQPLEDHVVTIARSHSAVRFPASFMLVAAMNPTPKGDVARDQVGKRAMDRYLARLSGPLIDRIDLHVEAPAVPWKDLADTDAPRGSSTAQMRAVVLAARRFQAGRQGPVPNARLSGRRLDELAPMDDDARALLGQAITELGLSARAYDKLRRVARTIADIDSAHTVALAHVAEAVQYRLLDRRP
ncbi:MAG: hypothetical protein C0475_03035 [Planctomyces sp.]|nr:hypothetical protein [Planctomyces sp.]MBA4038858.1 hypothetical protein [Planctomyces sp.]MBA4119746.1 hypothetical protein [Isosphaera sp.]